MPISNEAIENNKNRFIAVKGEATVAQVLAALEELGGQPWWHLLVQTSKGWGVTRVSTLCEGLEDLSTDAQARVDGWPGLSEAKAVEQGNMETRAAQALARKSPGSLLVVTHAGLPVGILVEGVSRTSRAIPAAKVGDLCGKYVNLKDYGSILLASSKKSK